MANMKNVFIEIVCTVEKQIKADMTKIQQVLINLVSNAIKFSPKGGIIRVEASYDESTEKLIVKVTDTGPGVSEEDQAKLFKPFGVIKKTMALNPNGTGLGLYICRKLCEEMGGTIRCKSDVYMTTF